MRVVVMGLLSLALPLVAQGQVFKCVDDADRVTYQDRPCPADSVDVPMGHAAISGMDSAAIVAAGAPLGCRNSSVSRKCWSGGWSKACGSCSRLHSP